MSVTADQLKCAFAELISELGGQIALANALTIALNAKAGSSKTISMSHNQAYELSANASQGPMVVHVRANLTDGALIQKLYLSNNKSDVSSATRAAYILLDDAQDVFLLFPGDTLYGYISGNTGLKSSIPVVENMVLPQLERLKRLASRGSRGS